MFKTPFTLGLFACFFSLVTSLSVFASPIEVRIGILSFRTIEKTRQQWQATADYLNTALPSHHFSIVPLYFPDMDKAVHDQTLDFVLTNPAHYVALRAEFGLEAMATLMPIENGHPVNSFGATIFTRADREDINTLGDLRGRIVASASEQSFGSYLVPRWTLLKQGIAIHEVGKMVFTEMPQDKVVMEVVSGRADAGFVRTGVLEGMAHENKIKLKEIKILNLKNKTFFPQMLSTDLYPEWPIASTEHTDENLVRAVSLALMNIKPEDVAAKLGGYYGFTEPGDYSSVEAVILRLQMQPNHGNNFDWHDIYQKYPKIIIAATLLLLCSMLAIALRFWRVNRQMQRHQFERDKLALHLQIANTTLEEKIQRRTQQLKDLQSNSQRMLDSMAEGMYGVDTSGNCTFVNAAFLRILGYEQEGEIIGKHIHELIHYAHQDGTLYPSHECRMYRAYQAKQAINVDDEVFWRKDGTSVAVEYWSHPIVENGKTIGAVATFLDITERKKAEAILLRNKVVIETAQDGFWMTNAQGFILEANQAYATMSGYSVDELLNMHISQLEANETSQEEVEAHIRKIIAQGSDQFETRHRHKNGYFVDVEVSVTFIAKLQLFFVFCRNISERKKSEQEIHQLAFYDSLTQLPNRRLLMDRLQLAFAVSERNAQYGAVMFLDLDRFKSLNDTKGHDIGDLLLIEVAKRLQLCVRDVDVVARFGGDEFVVVLEMLGAAIHEAANQAELLAEHIRDALNEPYQLKNHLHHATPSIGIVLFKGHHTSMDDLLKHADTAMYQSKNAGRNTIRFYDPALQAALQARIHLEQELHVALEQQQFRLFYQIQMDNTQRPLGAEGLLRWMHPTRGVVVPDEFVFLLEETGLIVNIGLWVLQTACEQLKMWEQDPVAHGLTLSINVSAKQFHQADFVAQLQRILQETGAQAGLLKLELTESTVLEHVDDTIAKMHELKSLGISLSMDDFGTGYSSLQYLKRLPLDQIKIDQAFVRDIVSDPNDAAIIQAIIAMSNALGLSVIAEGVENKAQQAFLERHGCNIFQGYLFSRPIMPEQFNTLLNKLIDERRAENVSLLTVVGV